ncbi:MAG: hypothetical protein IJC93_02960 [Clostridia bacterium]|nr:hypothetical protein [Clostridia bacterium]
MTDWITPLLSAMIPSLVCGILLALFGRRQSRKDAAVEQRAAARKKESLLSLEMNMASAKLSYAIAMAIKRGTPNGEVEEGVEAYEAAKHKYLTFLNEQATAHLADI